ncbi:MAG TPA: LacI family DNA-binding transcriptional regulator [Pseudonocardiaceae bacterium]
MTERPSRTPRRRGDGRTGGQAAAPADDGVAGRSSAARRPEGQPSAPTETARRPTIADIAKQAGLTKAAVSFALNGQPGVSEQTRSRVLDIARRVGWQPNSAARALSDGKAGAFGLVVDRPAAMLGVEPFFMQLISGIQAELSDNQMSLLFTITQDQASEIALYRSWWAQRKVDGVFVVDVRVADARIAALEELGMPAVVIGHPSVAGSLPAVWHDDALVARTVMEHLVALGHTLIGRVSGMPELRHTQIRTEAFGEAAGELGVTVVDAAGDYSGDSGALVTEELLRRDPRPTAVVYDNDLMAVSGLGAARRLGIDVPGDVSMVAWEDSPLCELVHPPLTALHRDVLTYGVHAARRLLAEERGQRAGNVKDAAHELVRRASSGPARRRSTSTTSPVPESR